MQALSGSLIPACIFDYKYFRLFDLPPEFSSLNSFMNIKDLVNIGGGSRLAASSIAP
jgi:hypothetical protein